MEQSKCLMIMGENSALGTNRWPLWTIHFQPLSLSFSTYKNWRDSSSSDICPKALPSPLGALSLTF